MVRVLLYVPPLFHVYYAFSEYNGTTALPVIEIADLAPALFKSLSFQFLLFLFSPHFPPEVHPKIVAKSQKKEVLIQLIAEMDFFLISTSLQISKEP